MTRHHRKSHQHSSAESGRGDKSSSTSDVYGCWKGTPISYTSETLQQDRSPHLTLKFDQGSSGAFEAQINVASTTTDTELVYWMNRNWTHPLTTTLTPLSSGFSPATTTDGTGLSLDFVRTKPALVDFAAGQLVQNDDSADTSNDILDELEPIVKDAIAAKTDVYIFGRDYQTGIDDVHMNQGNTGGYSNAVGHDGALIFHYATGDGHWEAVFLAFATQEIPTNNQTGAPEAGAKALDTIAVGGSSASNTN